MLSSGTTGQSTTDNTAITLIANSSVPAQVVSQVNVVNTGTVEGFVSIDNGNTWFYMPPGATGAPASRTFDLRRNPLAVVVKAKRVADGSNMTGLYADAY